MAKEPKKSEPIKSEAPALSAYVTTDKAGPRVAGRVVPRNADGRYAGFDLTLTPAEAEYELAQETIILKGDGAAAKTTFEAA